MDQEFANNVATGAKKVIGTLAKVALIGFGVAVAGGVLGGIVASAAAAGGLVTAGGVVIGLVGGSYIGGFLAKKYMASKAAPAIVAAGRIVDDLNKELEKQGAPSLQQQLGLDKELGGAFTQSAEKKPETEIVPLVAAPAPAAEKKPEAPAL